MKAVDKIAKVRDGEPELLRRGLGWESEEVGSSSHSAISLSIKGAAFRRIGRPSLKQHEPSFASLHESPALCRTSAGLKVLLQVWGK